MTAYYNENNSYAAEWLRKLISKGLIADGVVDERSIEDVSPEDLQEFIQCHFFAGIGIWSYALRQSGWQDSRPIWTGSCPCQPFSAAGKSAGFDDERHLWPSFQWLINEWRPAVVIGEQAASKAVEPWIDLLQNDLEGMGYEFGCVPFPAASVGSSHLRDRAYWVANADCNNSWSQTAPACDVQEAANRPANRSGRYSTPSSHSCANNSVWGGSDWLLFKDGRWRPVEPGTFPLVDEYPGRVEQLRAYGNAIDAEAAQAFIMSFMDVQEVRNATP